MTLLNFLESKQLSSKVNIFIVWIIGTLIYLQQGISPTINLSPIDLVLQAGLIYGYYFALVLMLRLLAFPITFITAPSWVDLFTPTVADEKNETTNQRVFRKFGNFMIGFIGRLIQVLAILIVFLFHPERLVYAIAPIGLVIVVIFYVLSGDDEKKPESVTEKGKSESATEARKSKPIEVENSRSLPIYVEIVNSNENPIEIKNSHYNPLHITVEQGGNTLPVNIVYGKNVEVFSSATLPVEVINVVTTQQADD